MCFLQELFCTQCQLANIRLKKQLLMISPIATSFKKTTNYFGRRKNSHRLYQTLVNSSFKKCFLIFLMNESQYHRFRKMIGSQKHVNLIHKKRSKSTQKQQELKRKKEDILELKQVKEVVLLMIKLRRFRMTFLLNSMIKRLLKLMEEKYILCRKFLLTN